MNVEAFVSGGILGLLTLLTDNAEVSSKMLVCRTRKVPTQLCTWESFHILLEQIRLTGNRQRRGGISTTRF